MEVVGLALKHGATQVQKARLSARGAEAGKATVRIGTLLARSGATIGAIVGLYDAMQANIAANRSWKSGDFLSEGLYKTSAILSGAGAVAGIWAAATGTSALLGPLGIAIILGLTGYLLFEWAKGEESTPLDRWARRCFFGNHDEVPAIHWNRPEHAPIAIGELNASTLGIEAGTNFKLRHYSASVPQAGYSIASGGIPSSQLFLEYRIVLPHFDVDRSAYCWILTAHHRGDGTHRDGEVLIEGRLNTPTASSERFPMLANPIESHKSNQKADTNAPTITTRTVQLAGNGTMHLQDIRGEIILPEDNSQASIESATLSLIYWPNRDARDAYAELIFVNNF
ncbi:hypothetical protein D3C77_369480 [compost metagenome]